MGQEVQGDGVRRVDTGDAPSYLTGTIRTFSPRQPAISPTTSTYSSPAPSSRASFAAKG